MVESAIKAGVPRAPLLADAGYGSSKAFRYKLRELGVDYAVGVNSTSKARLLSKTGHPVGKPQSLKTIASNLEARGVFRRTTWRQGTKGPLTARFVRRQIQISDDETATLLVEWRDHEPEPANYFFISISGPKKSTKQLVRLVMQRWRIERTYQDLKGELGLDHYEGRRFPGWHHHISVVLCCYSFVIAEKSRHFPPSPRGARPRPPLSLSPGAPLQGQLHHCPSCSLPFHLEVAPSLSELPSLPAPDLNLPLTQ